MHRYVLIIAGPTAVGKTYFAETLAQQTTVILGRQAEIVNMDVGQMYTPLSVGTAKPAWHSNPIPHHLFDILNMPVDYTVVAYREKIKQTLEEIDKRGALPILVGGSSFYLKSLLFPPCNSMTYNLNVFKKSEEKISWEALNAIDSLRAAKIHPHDFYRIQRAYYLWQTTKEQPSFFKPLYNPFCDHYQIIYLTREREQLYQRINDRVLMMIKDGLEGEVIKLLETPWESFLLRKKLIGYNEIIHYLKSESQEYTFDQVVSSIQQRTRNYAKRQETFIRGLKRDLELVGQQRVEMVNLTLSDVDLYIKKLLYKINKV